MCHKSLWLSFLVRFRVMGDLLGYARVSTVEQNTRLQTDALKSAGCCRVFTDRASGALDERQQLAKLFDQLRPGDTLVVWRLDRLGRSLRHLIDTVNALAERKIGFRSLTENIDTTTSGGKLVFHIFGALAEFERELIGERTRAGLEAARARGRRGGRPTVMTPDKVATARQMYDSKGFTVEAIARVVGVSRASIYRHLTGSTSQPVDVDGKAVPKSTPRGARGGRGRRSQ
jgi:DNA invertase Pin-like site-specific DNA recombinase